MCVKLVFDLYLTLISNLVVEDSIAVYVAIVAVLITVLGIFLSDKRTRESNTLTRTELKHRLRAWIKIQNLTMYLISVDGNRLPWDEYWLTPSKFPGEMDYAVLRTEITNIGEIPAIDLIGNFMQKNEIITKEMLECFDHSTKPFPLVPGDTLPSIFQISKNEYNNAKKEPLYFGLLVRYKVDNQVKGIGKIWKYDGSFTAENTWLEE